jgi:phosphoglycolate/pyridoxal phosphate phosphatase family enzyme
MQEHAAPAGTSPVDVHSGAIKGILFDLDGTIYLGDALISGAARAIATLKGAGVKIGYLTNKPIEPRDAYARKLTRLGVPTVPEEVVTSSLVLARWLRRQLPGATLFVVGEVPLQAELAGAGFVLTDDPAQVDVVVAAFDRTFDYRKLTIAMRAIKRGARFVATNPDRTCPTPEGEIPDCAAVVGAIEGCTGQRVEMIAGKPSAVMLDVALERLAVDPRDCLMVGDRLETDILMGRRAGVRTALVLSGIARREDLVAGDPAERPDFVVDTVGDLPALLGAAGLLVHGSV